MANTFTPPFTQVPKIGIAALAAANTARDGSGTVVTAFTAGSNGAYVKRVSFTPAMAAVAAISAKVFGIFISIDAGATWQYYKEVSIVTSTTSNSAIAVGAIVSFPDGLVLPAAALIGVIQTVYAGVQDRTQVVVEGSDY